MIAATVTVLATCIVYIYRLPCSQVPNHPFDTPLDHKRIAAQYTRTFVCSLIMSEEMMIVCIFAARIIEFVTQPIKSQHINLLNTFFSFWTRPITENRWVMTMLKQSEHITQHVFFFDSEEHNLYFFCEWCVMSGHNKFNSFTTVLCSVPEFFSFFQDIQFYTSKLSHESLLDLWMHAQIHIIIIYWTRIAL